MHKFSFKNNKIIIANSQFDLSYGEALARADAARITESNNSTKQQQSEHYKTISQPFALFNGAIRPADIGPGKTVEGNYDIWHNDMDADGVEDKDKANNSMAKKMHDHLFTQSSDTYTPRTTAKYIRTKMSLSSFPAESRIHRFMKNLKTGEAQDFIYAYTPTEVYKQIIDNNRGILRDITTQDRVAAVATARTQNNLSTNITDIEDPVSLVLTHQNPFKALYEGLMYEDAAPGISTEPEHMQGLCDCGDKKENHTNKNHPFLPRTISVNGRLVDGRNHRSINSPTRIGTFSRIVNGVKSRWSKGQPDDLQPQRITAHEHLEKQGIEVSPEDAQMVVRIGAGPEVVRSMYHMSMSARGRKPQSGVLPAIPSKIKPCPTCESTGKQNRNQRDGMHWDQDSIDPDITKLEVTINAETGKLMLIPDTKPPGALNGESNRTEAIFTTTPNNHCEDCDGAGEVEQEGKPKRIKFQFSIRPVVLDKIGNIITAAKMKSNDSIGWLPNANVSCATCGGDHDYRDNDMPCRSCRIGNLTSDDTDNPVAPTGSRYINENGIIIPLNHLVRIVKEVYGSDANPHRIVNDSDGSLGKRILPGDTNHTFKTKKDKRTGKITVTGQIGHWYQVINRAGRPVFKDEDSARAWIGRFTPGITIPQSHIDELNRMAAEIRKGPNAKQTSGSEELQLVCKYLKENLSSLPEQSFTAMRKPAVTVETDIPDSIKPDDLHYLGLEQPDRANTHKSIWPGIVEINKKGSELLDGDDSEIKNRINVFINAASQAAESKENFSDIPVDIFKHLNTSYQSIVDHLQERYPETTRSSLQDSFSKMIFPFIKKQSKTGDI